MVPDCCRSGARLGPPLLPLAMGAFLPAVPLSALLALLISPPPFAAAAAPPPWPTAFGPPSGSAQGLVAGALGPALRARALAAPGYAPAASLLLPAAGVALVVAQRLADGNYSLLALNTAAALASSSSSSSSAPLWAAPLLMPDSFPGPYASPCGPQAAALDACGAAFVAMSCGPEPLSLMNYVFAVDTSSGAARWSSRFDGTGGFAALLPSSDCALLLTTSASRDGPAQVAVLAAANGSQVSSFGSFGYADLQPAQAVFTLSAPAAAVAAGAAATAAAANDADADANADAAPAGGDTLFLANDPSWPYAAAFGGVGDTPAPAQQLFATHGPAGAGVNMHKARRVPPVALGAGAGASVLVAFDAPWFAAAGAHIVVQRLAARTGAVVWEARLPASAPNSTVTALATSSARGAVLVAVEYDARNASDLFSLDAASGAPLGAACSFSAAGAGGGAATSTVQRGLVVDDLAAGGAVASALVLGLVLPAPVPGSGGHDGRYFEGAANCTSLEIVQVRVGSCDVVGRAPLLGADALPFATPWYVPSAGGLLPYEWPALALGPSAGQTTVLVPGVGVLVVESA